MQHYFSLHPYVLYLFLLGMGFLSGFIDTIAGGGGLISVPALMYSGMPVTMALGTNKFQSVFGLTMAVYKYHRRGFINFKMIYRGLLMGILGAGSGAVLVNYISNQFMKYIIPFLLLGVFIFNLLYKELGLKPGKKHLPEHIFFPLFGFILGFYDAFFGPGTGNFWIIAIVFFLGYTFLEASGYAKVLNLKSNLIALSIFLYYGEVSFIIGIIMGIGQLTGSYLGAHMVILKGSKLVRPLFMAVIFVNILVLFYDWIKV
jgi:cupin 2 domain-containing protein